MKKLLYLLLSLLGFTACNEGGAGGGMMCEYGTPTTDFTVKGKVTDAAGVPIKGIVVSSKGLSSFIDGSGLSAVTGEDGTFVTNKIKEFGIDGTLVFTDTDGEANGGDFEKRSFTFGEPGTQIELGDIELTRVNSEE